jgi:hypothetical protein
MSIQFCAVCAWRENCNKKFCVPDGGAHCPDFTRDISLRDDACRDEERAESGAEGRERS